MLPPPPPPPPPLPLSSKIINEKLSDGSDSPVDFKTQANPLHMPHIPHIDAIADDLKKFSSIFNSYATKKTFATGFFNLALVCKQLFNIVNLISIL